MIIRILFILYFNFNCILFAYNYNLDIDNVESIPLEKKISQMLLVGFSGSSFSDELISYTENHNIGGVVYFNKSYSKLKKTNIISTKQVIELNKKIQEHSNIPAFIVISDDITYIDNLKNDFTNTIFSFNDIFSDKVNSAYEESLKIAKTLKYLGFNLDINNDITETIQDYSIFYNKFTKYIEAHQEIGIIKSINYIYNTNIIKDSNIFVDITEYDDVEQKDRLNFFHTNIVNSIMLPNAINNSIDSKYPASLSDNFISSVDKNLNYKSLIITDDLKERAVSKSYSLDEALIMAINSGANIIFYSNNVGKYNPEFVENAISIIKQNVLNGNIDIKKINDSYVKILQIKQQFKI